MIDGPRDMGRRALAEILVLIGLCLVGIIVFSGIGLVLASLILGVDFQEISNMMVLESYGADGRVALLIVQGIISLGSFVFLPSFIRFLLPGSPFGGAVSLKPNATLILLVCGLALLMMPVNAWLAAWNESIHFPSFLGGFQEWAQEKESEMEKLTLFLVQFSSPFEMALGFLVISLVAGFTEEFFFRKMLQPRVFGMVGNMHAAIWITAFIFSAIHMQFFGLVPRMVLGALFGYYFWWTGNFWISVFGHVLNNAITLVGLYLYKVNISPINVDDPHQIPWYLGAVAAGVTWSLASMVKEEADKIRLRRVSGARERINIPRF